MLSGGKRNRGEENCGNPADLAQVHKPGLVSQSRTKHAHSSGLQVSLDPGATVTPGGIALAQSLCSPGPETLSEQSEQKARTSSRSHLASHLPAGRHRKGCAPQAVPGTKAAQGSHTQTLRPTCGAPRAGRGLLLLPDTRQPGRKGAEGACVPPSKK